MEQSRHRSRTRETRLPSETSESLLPYADVRSVRRRANAALTTASRGFGAGRRRDHLEMATVTKQPPYRAYATILGTFAGGLGVAGVASRRLGRDPQCNTALDFVVLAVASFKAARTIARDEVTSFIREPFVEGHAHEGGEEPVQTGDLQQAIGE